MLSLGCRRLWFFILWLLSILPCVILSCGCLILSCGYIVLWLSCDSVMFCCLVWSSCLLLCCVALSCLVLSSLILFTLSLHNSSYKIRETWRLQRWSLKCADWAQTLCFMHTVLCRACVVMSYFMSSCVVLDCLVLSVLILSYHVWSSSWVVILSCVVLCCLLSYRIPPLSCWVSFCLVFVLFVLS